MPFDFKYSVYYFNSSGISIALAKGSTFFNPFCCLRCFPMESLFFWGLSKNIEKDSVMNYNFWRIQLLNL